MDKVEIARKYARDGEDSLLLRRVLDKLDACMRKCIPTATGFLNEHEQALCRQMLEGERTAADSFCFDGGYPEAERQVLAFLPDWQTPETMERPLCALRAAFSETETLTHRDFLGALMGVGIKRETVGDILVSPGFCDIVLLPEILPYVQQNLLSAGRAKLSLQPIKLSVLAVPEKQTKTLRETVASPRLDSLVASGFSMSREKAAALVRSGRVSVNALPCEKGDKELRAGDKISVRGLGRLEIESLGGTTKKGRTGVVLKRFL